MNDMVMIPAAGPAGRGPGSKPQGRSAAGHRPALPARSHRGRHQL